MDNFCIELGTLLDDPSVVTLEDPAKHSAHCLLDVEQCRDSGYEVLSEPTSQGELYGRAFVLNEEGNELMHEYGRSIGDCSKDCTGKMKVGLRAALVGTVMNGTGQGEVPATFAVTSIVEECDTIPLSVPLSSSNNIKPLESSAKSSDDADKSSAEKTDGCVLRMVLCSTLISLLLL